MWVSGHMRRYHGKSVGDELVEWSSCAVHRRVYDQYALATANLLIKALVERMLFRTASCQNVPVSLLGALLMEPLHGTVASLFLGDTGAR